MLFNLHFSFNPRPPTSPVSTTHDPYLDLEISPSTKLPSNFLNLMHSSLTSRSLPQRRLFQDSSPMMHTSHFDDASDLQSEGKRDNKMDSLGGFSIRKIRSTPSTTSRQYSIASFHFGQTPTKPSSKKGPPPPLQLKHNNKVPRTSSSRKKSPIPNQSPIPKQPPIPKQYLDHATANVTSSTSLKTSNSSLLNKVHGIGSEGLQKLAQRLLQSSPSDGEEQELYEGCLRKTSNMPTKASWPHPLRPTTNDARRLSIHSTASSSSGVPSLVFSEHVHTEIHTPSSNLASRVSKFDRKGSFSSTTSRSSNRSWFLADESPPSSPDAVLSRKGMSFCESVSMGLSVFDDSDDDEDDETADKILLNHHHHHNHHRHQRDCPHHQRELFLKVPNSSSSAPDRSMNTRNTATSAAEDSEASRLKTSPSLEKMGHSTRSNASAAVLPLLSDTPTTPSQSPVCTTPPRRRSRRRTASSECIIFEALEKMNAVMQEFAIEDINRKSVVGLDLPGNQVSVEAYGELYW